MSREIIKPSFHMVDVTVATTGKPVGIGHSGSGVTFHNSWNTPSGSLAGTLVFEGSNDPELDGIIQDGLLDDAAKTTAIDAARWADVTALASITVVNPTTAIGSQMVVIDGARFWWVRLRLTGVTGTGNFSSYVATHGDG